MESLAQALSPIGAFIREFGFPVFTCLWLMWLTSRRLTRLEERLERLAGASRAIVRALEIHEGSDKPKEIEGGST